MLHVDGGKGARLEFFREDEEEGREEMKRGELFSLVFQQS